MEKLLETEKELKKYQERFRHAYICIIIAIATSTVGTLELH